jgi:hypothetical protein
MDNKYTAFEDDLRDLFKERLRSSEEDCRDMWGALCNVDWNHPAYDAPVSYSFRAAGGLISEVLGEGCYMDWYCSGNAGVVPDWIKEGFASRNWIPETDESFVVRFKDSGF